MTDFEPTLSPSRMIDVRHLEKSPLNARRTRAGTGIGELKASLLAHGLMQNLVVTEAGDGRYRVIAGGRRLEAIHALQQEGKLPPDFAVPCQVVTEENAPEMSLAENTVRLAMHPADQFEAFAELIERGRSAAQVAERFGVEESLVLKRLKLARVAPELFDAYRRDAMTLECLMAFTITDDHRRQRKVYRSLPDWRKDDPQAIRDALTEQMVEADSKLARFVGLDAYTAAGGGSRSDLFGEAVYLEKPALLNKLAEAKLDALRGSLEAEGWGWIEVNPERDWNLIHRCNRIKPMLIEAPAELLERKSRLEREAEEIERNSEETDSPESVEQRKAIRDRLDAVEEKLVAFVGFDADQKALAGCFVSLDPDGIPLIDKGLVRPEHRKALAKLLRTEETGKEPSKGKEKGALPETLRRDLADSRLRVAQLAIARHPAIAFDLLVFQVALRIFDAPSAGEGVDVQFHRSRPNRPAGTEPTPAGDALEAIAKSLPLDWLQARSEATRFERFRSLPEPAKHDLLAYCTALTLRPKLAPGVGEEPTGYDLALALTGTDAAAYWRPSRDHFPGRLNRERLLAIGREVFGEAWAQAHGQAKKASLVDQLHRGFSDPDRSGRTPEQIARLKNWLPEGMAFTVPAPRIGKARKTRKSA